MASMDKGSVTSNTIFRVILFTFLGGFIFVMASGIRNNYGIMLDSIIVNSGVPFTTVSFILAVGQFVFGAVQPAFGILASKKGNVYALVSGVVLTVTGLLLLPLCRSTVSLMIVLGFILPAGTGALGFGIIMGAVSPNIPAKAYTSVAGIIIAGHGLGNVIMSPAINSLIETGGLMHSMLILSLAAALMLPIAIIMGRKPKIDSDVNSTANEIQSQKTEQISTAELLKKAMKSRTYLYLAVGFFTCGFHMSLLINHLPAQFLSYGFSSQDAANAFSMYGFAAIIGAVTTGFVCIRMKMKNVLGIIYGLRPVTIIIFLFMPVNIYTITAFTTLLGVSGAATVTPVSGLVKKSFGTVHLATLYGFVFCIHQVGGFFGAWFGGICYDLTGSYTIIWLVTAALGAIAAAASFVIKEPD